MPILPPEPDLYPSTLFDKESGLIEGRNWWVLHTRSRQEKSLARELLKQQIPYYLPLFTSRNLIRGRAFESQLPLFPNYLFLLAQSEERLAALETRRVVRSLAVPNQNRLWEDLFQLRQLVASGLPIRPEDRLIPGAPVVIRSGVLEGLRGVILRAANAQRFVVQVDFIGRGASILLNDYMLAALSPEGQAET